jgi:GT2 family glycosyltransferase
MTRLPAILNVINNKCCGTFQARSWIIFHFQGKDSTRAWLAKLSTHRRRNIYVFQILHRLIDQTILNERYGCLWLKCILSDIQNKGFIL